MKKILLLPAILTAFAVGGPLAAQPSRVWNQGNPTGDEQYALEVLNRIRKDPNAAVEFYIGQANQKPALKTLIDTFYFNGAAGIRSAVAAQVTNYPTTDSSGVRTAPPKAPFAFYPLFTAVAKTLSPPSNSNTFFYRVNRNQVPSVATLFISNSDGAFLPALSGPNATGGTAVSKTGGTNSTGAFTLAQNIWHAYYTSPTTSIRDSFLTGAAAGTALISWLDDAFTLTRVGFGGTATITRGKTRMIGITIGDLDANGARILTAFSTDNEAFATSDLPFGLETVFITGVAYADRDFDHDYTSGEGLGDVSITPNTGEWMATTSASGGYAIPVRKNSGSYTVVAKRTDGTEISSVVNVGNDNVKVDFVFTDTVVKPGQETVAASSGSTKFLNLSTRGVAGIGENGLFGGFVISGGSKKVLIRGVAKALLGFGLDGVLRKPLLTVYDSTGKVVASVKTQDIYDDTKYPAPVKAELAAAFASVGAFAFPSSTRAGRMGDDGAVESAGDTALVISLNSGLYSVSITSDSDTLTNYGTPLEQLRDNDVYSHSMAKNGLVLLEIYDMEPNTAARFVNISTRGQIESGARQMIVGFVVAGTGNRQLLVRGIGPMLKNFGVAGALDAIGLDVFNAKGELIRSNTAWTGATWTDQSIAVGASVGAFDLAVTSTDSVVLFNAPNGQYSAAVKSLSGAPGIGLAEIYEVR